MTIEKVSPNNIDFYPCEIFLELLENDMFGVDNEAKENIAENIRSLSILYRDKANLEPVIGVKFNEEMDGYEFFITSREKLEGKYH